MTLSKRFLSLITQVVQIAAIAIALSGIFAVTPVLAQNNPTAAITLDGRKLFEVSQSGRYTAEERAEDANRVLKSKVKSPEPPLVVAKVDSGKQANWMQLKDYE